MRIVFLDANKTPWFKDISPDGFMLEELCRQTKARIVLSQSDEAKPLRYESRLLYFWESNTDGLGPDLASEAKRWLEGKVDIESYVVIPPNERFGQKEFDIAYKVLTS